MNADGVFSGASRKEVDPDKVIWRPPDFIRVLSVLQQGILWIVLAPIVGIAATILYLMINDPLYTIGAQLMVREGRETVASTTVTVGSTQALAPVTRRQEDAIAEVQILKDPQILRSIVADIGEEVFFPEPELDTLLKRMRHAVSSTLRMARDGIRDALVFLGLTRELTPLDRIVLFLETALTIDHVARSEVIELGLRFPDPSVGEDILSRYIARYLERRQEVFRSGRALAFFEAAIGPLEATLREREDELRRARQALSAWSVDEQRRLLVEAQSRLSQDLREMRVGQQSNRARLAAVRAELDRLPETVPASSVVGRNQVRDDLRIKRIETELGLIADQRRFGSRSQEAEALAQQLAHIVAELEAEPDESIRETTTRANPVREALLSQETDLLIEVAELESRRAATEQALAEVEADLDRIGEAELRVTQLELEVGRLRQGTERYRSALDEARIEQAIFDAQLSNIAVVAAPTASLGPTSPRLGRTILIAVVFSVAGAAGIILVIDSLHPRVRSDADILAVTPGTLARGFSEQGRGS